jgi:hypothetical protein
MDNNSNFSKEFIEQTRKVWEPICKKQLSDDECIEIANNVISLELLLREIAEENEAANI